MKVLNVHSRTVQQPISEITKIFETLASRNDLIWPTEKWPAMRFKDGIQIDALGGHGPIRYSVEHYDPSKIIQFRFLKPEGFNGIHKLELSALSSQQTNVTHTIDMNTEGKATLMWLFAIRPLHDALIEDAFDKLENNFSINKKTSKWSTQVKILRKQIDKRIK